jgi:hypothetical protein
VFLVKLYDLSGRELIQTESQEKEVDFETWMSRIKWGQWRYAVFGLIFEQPCIRQKSYPPTVDLPTLDETL